MKLLALLSLTFVIVACNSSGTSEGDVSSGNINIHAPYIWGNKSFPKKLLISDAFTMAETDTIKEMSLAWKTAVNNTNFFDHTSDTTPEISHKIKNMDTFLDSTFGIYKSNNWPLTKISGGALAVTQLYGIRQNIGDSNEYVDIRHADIIVNDHYYNFYTNSVKDNRIGYDAGHFDLRTVILHEMGHFLGLGHRPYSDDSIMIESVGENSTNRIPTSLDKQDIADKYGMNLFTKTSGFAAMSIQDDYYKPTSDKNQEVRIVIELRADGECVHKENGVVVKRHSADIK